MKLTIPKSQGKVCPSGTHVARLYQVIDMGTQASPNFGPAQKIRFTWELPLELDTFKEGEPERPYVVSKEYTLSMNEKSNFRKDLESWRGKPFTDSEIGEFDTANVLGKPCMVTVMHTEKKGKIYANVTTVANIPKGMTVPEQINASIAYSVSEGNNTAFKALPDWLQEKLSQAPEFHHAEGSAECKTSNDSSMEVGKEDIPF